MKKVLILGFFLCLLTGLKSQHSALYLEAGGSAGLASLNYERQFKSWERSSLAWRAGLSGFYIDQNTGLFLIFPLSLNYLHGSGPHKWEVGFGQGLTLGLQGKFFLQSIPQLGYRFQPKDRKILFRATYTPLVSYLIDFQWRHWLGLSIGFRL